MRDHTEVEMSNNYYTRLIDYSLKLTFVSHLWNKVTTIDFCGS